MTFDGFLSGAPVTPLPQALLRDLAPAIASPNPLLAPVTIIVFPSNAPI